MYELRLFENKDAFLNDIQDVARAFSPYLIVTDESQHFLEWNYCFCDSNIISLNIISDLFGAKNYRENLFAKNDLDRKKLIKRFIKKSLYVYLSEALQVKLPYGSLTGVRPTKIYYELNDNLDNKRFFIEKTYGVFPEKAKLIENCVLNQKQYINNNKKNIGLFINIPFCPTRCKYCSFISTEVFRIKNKLAEYTECVKKELDTCVDVILKNGFDVRTIYIGGGTPTSIGEKYLNEITEKLKCFNVEFTVEAGRPDTINESIADMLKNNNVTRISVNPQTFSDETLKYIGRNHTVQDFVNAYKIVKERRFSINVDLIAGLPLENEDTFLKNIEEAIAFYPDNITVHALSLKRGSAFLNEGMKKQPFGNVYNAISNGHRLLENSGYIPYYMYRQKNTADNLENVGFTLKGKQCKYNIDMMEEASHIIGIGAGAMSKLIEPNGKIERLSTPKGINEYCERIESTVLKKIAFFSEKM